MTDRELDDAVAAGVMGWAAGEVEAVPVWIGSDDGDYVARDEFMPTGCDDTCMMAWDEFIESEIGILSDDAVKRISEEISEIMLNDVGADRRRGLCGVMAKAVS